MRSNTLNWIIAATISVGLHLGGYLALNNNCTLKKTDNSQKASITTPVTGFNAKIDIGKNIVTTKTKEDIGDNYQSNEGNKNNLDSLEKSMDDLKGSIDKLETMVDLIKYSQEGGNIEDLYKHTHQIGERNETTYSEFFRSYASGQLLLYDTWKDIKPVLEKNSNIGNVANITFRFEANGTFYIEEIEAREGTIDPEGKIVTHYINFFNSRPNDFVSPLEAGLEAPYFADYTIRNRAQIIRKIEKTQKENVKEIHY